MVPKRLNQFQNEILKLEEMGVKNVNEELWNIYNAINKDIRKRLKLLVKDYENLPVYQKANAMRLFSLSNQISEIINDTYDDNEMIKVEKIIQNFADGSRDEGYFSTFYQIENETGQELPIKSIVDSSYIRHSLANPIKPSLLSGNLNHNRDKLAKKAGEALRSGLIQGKGYRDIASEITRWTESTYKQSLRIAITEGHRIRGQAKQRAQEDAVKMGARIEKMWLSALDTRVRSSHRKLDGQVVRVDEEFTNSNGNKTLSPGNFGIASEDINCRCSVVSVVNGIKPSERRDGYGRTIAFKNYREWQDDLIKNRGQNWWDTEEKKNKNKYFDQRQYKEYNRLLGREVPSRLDSFQNLKYNKYDKWTKLEDHYYVKSKIENGTFGKIINPEKQAYHMESTAIDKKSYFYDDFDHQSFFNKFAGTGKMERTKAGDITNKEIIHLAYDIEVVINGVSQKTNNVKIHHSEKRTHIVPRKRV